MKRLIVVLVFAVMLMGLPAAIYAGGSKIALETMDFLSKKFAKEILQEGGEKVAGRLASAIARHGDDVVTAVRKVGPKALQLVDDAGEQAPRAIRLLSRYGDDAVRVLSHPKAIALFSMYGDDAAVAMMRHPGIATPLLEKFGEPAARALNAVGERNGRRLAMMKLGSHSVETLDVIAKHGEPAMEFIWKHKGVLAGGAALAAFLANPEPYLSGTKDILQTTAQEVMKPVIQTTGNVVEKAVDYVFWGLFASALAAAVVIAFVLKAGIHKNPIVQVGAKVAIGKLFNRL